MVSPRRLPKRQVRPLKQGQLFDPKAFLANAGIGRTIHQYGPKQAIFSQGKPADAVYYIQAGRVRLSVVSKQGKEATIALLGPRRFFRRGMHRFRSNRSHGIRDRNYGVCCPKD